MKPESTLSPFSHITRTPAEALRDVLLKRMARNPAYSLRAFARDLEVSHTYLSLVINGKKRLSRNKTLRFAEMLGISPNESSPLSDYTNLKEEQFQVLNQWYHLPILDLTLTANFKPDVKWISRRLGIKPAQTQDAIERLQKLGLLANWKKQSKKIEFFPTRSHEAVRAYHAQMIEKSLTALKSPKQEDYDLRHITGATVTVNPKHIPEVKKKIEAFKKKLLDWLGSEDGSEVFQLNVQFFGLTKKIPDKEKGKNK